MAGILPMTDPPTRETPTREALIALHFQNDTCHPQGRIPFSLDRGSSDAQRFLDASKRTLEAARRSGWTIVHKHIVLASDYSDILRNCRLFLKAEALGRSSVAHGARHLLTVSSHVTEKSLSPAMATAPSGGPVWRGCSANVQSTASM